MVCGRPPEKNWIFEGISDYEFTVVSGAYDEGQADDAGKPETD